MKKRRKGNANVNIFCRIAPIPNFHVNYLKVELVKLLMKNVMRLVVGLKQCPDGSVCLGMVAFIFMMIFRSLCLGYGN